jgi:molecular chaperone DnaK (HSP70)
MSRIYGVDLGTTFTTAAWVDEHGTMRWLRDTNDSASRAKALASMLYFDAPGSVVVGEEARRECVKARGKGLKAALVTGAKRELGKEIPEPGDEQAATGADPTPPYEAFEVAYSPVEANALVLMKLKQLVDRQEPEHPLERMVLTHPHFFKEPQKVATRLAADLAGIEVVELMTEPNAAAVACLPELAADLAGVEVVELMTEPKAAADACMPDPSAEVGKVMIFDLGGGTLDITLFEVGSGGFVWRGGAGNPYLGGRDFDNALLGDVKREWAQRAGHDYGETTSVGLAAKLDGAVQRLKIDLQDPELPPAQEIGIRVSGGDLAGKKEPVYAEVRVSRERFDRVTKVWVESAKELVHRALSETHPQWLEEEVQAMVVGGSGRLLSVQRMLRDLGFNVVAPEYMDQAIARGAATRAHALAAGKIGKPRGRDGAAGTDLDAAPVSGIALSDVPPAPLAYSVGVKAYDPVAKRDIVTWLADKGDAIANAGTEREFLTLVDDAAFLEIELHEGDPKRLGNHPLVDDCARVGAVKLPAPPGKRGQKVRVRLRFEPSGIAIIEVTDPKSGRRSSAPIDRRSKPPPIRPVGAERKSAYAHLHLEDEAHMRERLAALRVR